MVSSAGPLGVNSESVQVQATPRVSRNGEKQSDPSAEPAER